MEDKKITVEELQLAVEQEAFSPSAESDKQGEQNCHAPDD